MSVIANIDIGINISYLQVKQFHRLGYLRYRMCIYHQKKGYKNSNNRTYCHPYNEFSFDKQVLDSNCSLIDENESYFYSQVTPIKYANNDYNQNHNCFFKVYLDMKLFAEVEFIVEVDLLFTQNSSQDYRVVSTFKAQINNFYNISTYLPISFDHFQAFCICATYNSVIIELKFGENFCQMIKDNLVKENSDLSVHKGNKENTFQTFTTFLNESLKFLQSRYKKINQKIEFNESKIIKISKQCNKLSLIGKQNRKQIIENFLLQQTQLKNKIYEQWKKVMQFTMNNSLKVTNIERSLYESKVLQRYKSHLFSHRITDYDWTFCKYEDNRKQNSLTAYKQRNKCTQESGLWTENFPIQNLNLFGHQNKNIKLFEEIYCKESNSTKYIPSVKHIIFLIHGYRASKNDMLMLKYCLQNAYNVEVYACNSNSGKTEDSLLNMGKRLALEIGKSLQPIKQQFKVSFIGHSMGGLIIRSAISHLSKYAQFFHSYISICTPHLGYLYEPSVLTRAALWFLTKWQKCESINELMMQDSSNLRGSLLYRLANREQFKDFHHLAFISSSQDEYVPYHSSRIQKNSSILNNALKGTIQSEVICEMTNSLLEKLRVNQISRIDSIFDIKQNFDSIIGRSGHVKFLSDPQFINYFVRCFSKFFQ